MYNTLAQTATNPNAAATTDPATAEAVAPTIDLWEQIGHVFQTSVSIFSRGDTLASPDKLIPELAQLGTIWALVFVIMGMVCLLNGYKFHKALIVVLVVLMGAMLGYWMGLEIQGPPFVVAGCVATLLAVLALPLMNYTIALLGGLSGAFIGANLWAGLGRVLDQSAELKQSAQADAAATGQPATGGELVIKAAEIMPADSYWIGALIGLVFCGLAAFVLSKITIHLFTSVSGSTIAVFGVIALLLSIDPFSATVQQELTRSPLVVPLLVFVPAAIGIMLQKKNSGGWIHGSDPAPAS